MNIARRAGAALWCVWIALGLAACAALDGAPRTVTITQAQLERAIAKQFPFNGYGEFFDVQVTRPQVLLLPQDNRIGTEMDVVIAPRLLAQPLKGRLAIDSALRFEPSDNSVRLAAPRVRRLDLDGLPAGTGDGPLNLNRLGAYLLEQVLRDATIYRFKADELARAGVRLAPGEFRVTNGGVLLTLTPAP